jgi:FAD:protein FMN transferase
MFHKISLLLCCSVFLVNLLFAQQLRVLEGKAQGTYFVIKFLSADTTSLAAPVDSIFAAIDQSLSLYKPGSLINQFNNGDSVKMDEHMMNVVHKAMWISRISGGTFDITVKPLVDAWGFGVRTTTQHALSPDTLRLLLQQVGYRRLKIRGQQLIKKKAGVAIDCNGIAQGYTTDVLARFLESRGISNYLVDVGGELRSKGHNAKQQVWTVGIERPADETGGYPVQAVLSLKDKAITTSGNYRRFFDQGGTRFAHTIDPVSGQALHNNIITVTVIADDAMTADGFDNALMVMGVEKSLLFIARHPEYHIEAAFVYKDKTGTIRERFSPGFKKLLLSE